MATNRGQSESEIKDKNRSGFFIENPKYGIYKSKKKSHRALPGHKSKAGDTISKGRFLLGDGDSHQNTQATAHRENFGRSQKGGTSVANSKRGLKQTSAKQHVSVSVGRKASHSIITSIPTSSRGKQTTSPHTYVESNILLKKSTPSQVTTFGTESFMNKMGTVEGGATKPTLHPKVTFKKRKLLSNLKNYIRNVQGANEKGQKAQIISLRKNTSTMNGPTRKTAPSSMASSGKLLSKWEAMANRLGNFIGLDVLGKDKQVNTSHRHEHQTERSGNPMLAQNTKKLKQLLE